ncbi:MAG TPA: FIST N-terminal domain-containing protein, partial [Acidimicrobiales bacterium]
MPFAAALSQHPDAAEATGDAVGRVLEGLAGATPDLAVLFCSPHHVGALGDIAATVRRVLAPGVLLGAGSAAVVGGDREVEDGPAVSLWAATLPSPPRPVRITAARTASGTAVQGLPVRDLPPGGTLVLLTDPFSLPVDAVLEAVAAAGSPVRVVGGLASPSGAPGDTRLVLDGDMVATGAVGALLDADTATTAVVSQGCRPIGEPMIVTRAQGNVIAELAGRTALERVAELAGR